MIDSSEEFQVMYGKNMGRDSIVMSVGGMVYDSIFVCGIRTVYNIKNIYALL